jgi:hypothetical protein
VQMVGVSNGVDNQERFRWNVTMSWMLRCIRSGSVPSPSRPTPNMSGPCYASCLPPQSQPKILVLKHPRKGILHLQACIRAQRRQRRTPSGRHPACPTRRNMTLVFDLVKHELPCNKRALVTFQRHTSGGRRTSSTPSAVARLASFRATIDTSAPCFVSKTARLRPRPVEPPVT